MAGLPPEIKEEIEKLKPDRDGFSSEEIGNFGRRHDEILLRGFADNPFTPPEKRKKGRPKRTPPLNLLIRLRDYRSETPAFMYDFRAPSDNNAAERDVRMMESDGRFRAVSGHSKGLNALPVSGAASPRPEKTRKTFSRRSETLSA